MIPSTGKRVVSPDWRVRRRALSDWLDDHDAAIAAGRARIWVANGPTQARLNRDLLDRHTVLLPPPARTTAALAHELAIQGGWLLEVPGHEEILAYVAAALAGADGAAARYAPFATRPNTCRALAATLERLRREAPDPSEWVDRWGAAVSHRRQDLAALAALEQELLRLLARHGKVLPPTVHRAAADALAAGWPGTESLLLYDLSPLSASERFLLEAILAAAPADQTLIAPGDDGARGLFTLQAPLLELFSDSVAPPADDSLAMRLYRPGAVRRPEPVESLRAPTAQRGVQAVLREILRAIEGGTAPGRIVIVAPNLTAQATMIRAEAARVGLPMCVLAPRWSGVPEKVELALRLLQLLAAGFPRRPTLELLRAAPGREGLRDDHLAALERVSLAAGIVGGSWREWGDEIRQLAQLRQVAPARVARVTDAELALALEAVERLQRQFGEAGPTHPTIWRRRLRERLGWLSGAALEVGESGAPAPEERDPLRALAALDAWPEAGTLTVDEYLGLAEGLLAAGGPSDEPSPGAVLVTDRIARGAGETELVYLLDAVAGSLPPPRGELVPLDGHDLAAMGVRGGGSEAAWLAASADFLDLVTAGARLVLVTPASDEAGGATLPSPLVRELGEVIEPPAERRVRAEDRWPAEARTISEAVLAAAAGLAGAMPAGGAERVASVARRVGIELARLSGEPSRYDGDLTGTPAAADLARVRFGPAFPFAASSLEDYATWPFDWFAQKVLRLSEEREPVGYLDALLEGNLIHELLRLACETCRDPATREATLAALVSETLGAERRQPGIPAAVWGHGVGRLESWCRQVLEGEQAALTHLEQSFGQQGWPPLVLGDGNDRTVIHGRIDRVERREDGWFLLDYKRSKPKSGALNWQLPLYARKAREELAEPLAGWALLVYRSGEFAAGVDVSNVEDEIDQTVAAVLAGVRRIRAGDFRPLPAPKAEPWANWAFRAAARVLDREGQTEGDDD